MFFFFSSDNYPRERIKNKKLLKKKKFPEIVTFPFFPSSSPLPSFPLPLTPRQNFLDYPIFLFILYCIHDYSVQRGEPTTTRHFRNRIILAESRRSHRSKSSIWYIRYSILYRIRDEEDNFFVTSVQRCSKRDAINNPKCRCTTA